MSTILSGLICAGATYYAVKKTSELDRYARKEENFYKTLFNDLYQLKDCYVNLLSKCNYGNFYKEDLIPIKDLSKNYTDYCSYLSNFKIIIDKWNNKLSKSEKEIINEFLQIFDKFKAYLFVGISNKKPLKLVLNNNIEYKKIELLKEQCQLSDKEIKNLKEKYKKFIDGLIDNLKNKKGI